MQRQGAQEKHHDQGQQIDDVPEQVQRRISSQCFALIPAM